MPTVELRAEPRTVLGKRVRRLRQAGIIPANIFGHGASRAIQAPARTFDQVLGHGGRASIVAITLDGGESQTALVKDVQRDPRTGRLLHVDFQAVSMNETVRATVPLHFVGEAPAARAGGLLLHPATEVEVEALASNLPEAIDVDLSGLVELHSSIKAGDLAAPAGVKVITPAEEVVATVQPPRVEREEVEEAIAEAAVETAGPAQAAPVEER